MITFGCAQTKIKTSEDEDQNARSAYSSFVRFVQPEHQTVSKTKPSFSPEHHGSVTKQVCWSGNHAQRGKAYRCGVSPSLTSGGFV